MLKLPKLEVIKETAKNSFEQEVESKYEELMQRFAAGVTRASNAGYIGWSETFTYSDAVLLAALDRCKKQIRKEGYRCHIDWHAYNSLTNTYDGIAFTISWRRHWFDFP